MTRRTALAPVSALLGGPLQCGQADLYRRTLAQRNLSAELFCLHTMSIVTLSAIPTTCNCPGAANGCSVGPALACEEGLGGAGVDD